MSCLHQSQLNKLKPPAAFSKVYKEECTLCFITPDAEAGLNVCLTCFNGGCTGVTTPDHSALHYRKTSHCLVLNLVRIPQEGDEENHQPAKLTKVEIKEDEEPSYDYSHLIRCLACSSTWPVDSPEVTDTRPCVQAIISSLSASKQLEAQAWQEEATACEHSKNLEQSFDPLACQLREKTRCSQCDLRENLWMCLTCGAIGCGRKQFDGSGGNGHGAQHFNDLCHPLAIKLGTITPEGNGDVHCYLCNEMRLDPNLAHHLSAFGIDISTMEKTEQTMAELQLEQNIKFDFSMVTDYGKQLESVRGPELIGLKNLGNSCYFNSVIQSLFHLQAFRDRYGDDSSASNHFANCHKDTASCFICQASKVGLALGKGHPEMISPWMLKAVVTNGHPEFSTPRQQDASEFLIYLLKVVQRNDPVASRDLVDRFTFTQQQKLCCDACGDSRYQKFRSTQLSLQLTDILTSPRDNFTIQDTLSLDQFLTNYFGGESIETGCGKCGAADKTRSMSMLSFPKYLVITLSRYIVRNWVPQKFDMSIQVPFDGLDLASFHDKSGIIALNAPSEPQVDPTVLSDLLSMGFPKTKCIRAIVETKDQSLESAMNWILENGDLDMEGNTSVDGVDGTSMPEEMIQVLVDAGFDRHQAVIALRKTDCNIERAFDWILNNPEESIEDHLDETNSAQANPSRYKLVAFVSHKGPSVQCGHYIAHVRLSKSQDWIMFNDERVALADPQPPLAAAEKAYVLVYENTGL